MKILVIGFGSIGKRHIKNIKAIEGGHEIAVLRQKTSSHELGEYQVLVSEVFHDHQQALEWGPQAVFVCNPAPLHVSSALEYAKRGIPIFMEKPLSVSLKEAQEFVRVCQKQNSLMMVGYVLRFLESLKMVKSLLDEGRIGKILSISAEVGRYLPLWRPQTDYRQNVSARAELGGGIISELSHELDYMRWLAGDIAQIGAVADHVSDLEIDVEDVAEITMRFKSGAVGHVHMDMLDMGSKRSCRLIGSEGTLVWSFVGQHEIRLFKPEDDKGEVLWSDPEYEYNEMFLDEVKHFFDCIQMNKTPCVTGEDGCRALELILAAKESSQTGKVITL